MKTFNIVELEATDKFVWTKRDGSRTVREFGQFQNQVHAVCNELERKNNQETAISNAEIALLEAQAEIAKLKKQLRVKQLQVNEMEKEKVTNRYAIYDREVEINILKKDNKAKDKVIRRQSDEIKSLQDVSSSVNVNIYAQ